MEDEIWIVAKQGSIEPLENSKGFVRPAYIRYLPNRYEIICPTWEFVKYGVLFHILNQHSFCWIGQRAGQAADNRQTT